MLDLFSGAGGVNVTATQVESPGGTFLNIIPPGASLQETRRLAADNKKTKANSAARASVRDLPAEEILRRAAQKAASDKARLDGMSEEELSLRAAQKAARLDGMSEEELSLRAAQKAASDKARLDGMSEEELSLRAAQKAASDKARLDGLSEEELSLRAAQKAASDKARLDGMSEEDRRLRAAQMANHEARLIYA